MAAPEADTLPPVYTEESIRAELAHWRAKLIAARAGSGKISEDACLHWLDKWLDELLERRGR